MSSENTTLCVKDKNFVKQSVRDDVISFRHANFLDDDMPLFASNVIPIFHHQSQEMMKLFLNIRSLELRELLHDILRMDSQERLESE